MYTSPFVHIEQSKNAASLVFPHKAKSKQIEQVSSVRLNNNNGFVEKGKLKAGTKKYNVVLFDHVASHPLIVLCTTRIVIYYVVGNVLQTTGTIFCKQNTE